MDNKNIIGGKEMKRLFTTLIAIVFAISLAEAQNVGEIAPDFSLDDINNQNYTLSKNRGDVILVFLIGYNCSLCISSAPTVKSTAISPFSGNSKFQAIVIDTWDGTLSGVKSFQSTTEIDATYLQKGSNVASSWSTTYDRLVVIDTEGKIIFKGSRAAKSDANAAKEVIQNALNALTTSTDFFESKNGFNLAQNYPNPAENSTKIKFSIGKSSDVTLSVSDITGKKVLVPVFGYYPTGDHEVLIQGLNKGIYFYTLETKSFVSTKKMIFR